MEVEKKPARKEIVIEHIEFPDYLWEKMYVQNQMKVLKGIDRYGDIHRLYLIMRLDMYQYDLLLTVEKIEEDYPKQNSREQEIIHFLKKSIRDADPIFLELAGESLSYKDDNAIQVFVNLFTTGKRTVYPKLSPYQECMKTLKLIKSLTIDFRTDHFLEICPDPMEFIHKIKTCAHVELDEDKLIYLFDKFPTLPKTLIKSQFYCHYRYLLDTVDELENTILDTQKYPESSESRQLSTGQMIYLAGKDDINLLKEIAYVENKESIEFHITTKINMRLSRLEEAKLLNLLYNCQCCYETELLDSEICCCPKGHTFCLKCIQKFVEIEVGFKKLEFKCMTECTERFNLDMLTQIVDDKLGERLLILLQAKDIKAANIEDLESCRFCHYAASVPQDLKVFSCLNPECGKEICRFCGEDNHLPLTCDEIEKTPELQVRIMIENKMSEVLIRVCPNCNNSFLKESGCNRMICTCGTRLCYICKEVIPPFYEHFFHDKILPDKCPLYTDENVVHVAVVEAAARIIINELRETNPELLNKINIDKLLPNKLPTSQSQEEEMSVSIDNEVIAKILGENVKKINRLKDMRSFSPESKRIKPN